MPIRSNLPSDWEWRLPNEIVDLIYAEVFRPISDDDNPKFYHYILQRRLKALGERLGFEAQLEFPTPYIDSNRSGRIDVVWTAPEGGRSVAIEIDTTWKRRSITKLTYISDTHLPVWIFLGLREVPHIPEGHPMAKIHLIRVDPARVPRLPPTLHERSRRRPATGKVRRRRNCGLQRTIVQRRALQAFAPLWGYQ